MQSVQFRSISMAGHLYLPNGFKESEQYPAIVCVSSGRWRQGTDRRRRT